MTEKSWFWGHGGGGDASLSSYTIEEITDVMRLLFEAHNEAPSLISRAATPLYSMAIVFNGTNITVNRGAAKIDGKVYTNLGPKSFDCSTPGFYRLLLQKEFPLYGSEGKGIVGGQTVSLRLLYGTSFNAVSLGTTQQDLDRWDNILGYFCSDGRLVYPCDANGDFDDRFAQAGGLRLANCHTVNLLARQGGDAGRWHLPGTTMYIVGSSRLEVGSIAVGANPQAVTFAEAFGGEPVVIVQPYDFSNDWTGNNHCISAISPTAFSVRFDSITNLDAIHYMAYGDI